MRKSLTSFLANVTKKTKTPDSQLIELAKSANDTETSFEYLIGKGANLNAKDENGWTPLMHAACNNRENILQSLLKFPTELNINAVNKEGKTALMLAIEKDSKKSIEILLSAYRSGFDTDSNALDKEVSSALLKAVEKNDLKLVELLIGKGAANLNAEDENGWTPLMHAACNNRENILQSLLKFPAKLKINAVNKEGKTALMLAIEKDSKESIEILLSADRSGFDIDFNALDKEGSSALLKAVEKNDLELVKILISKEATEVSQRYNFPGFGYEIQTTALMIAITNDYKEVAKLLAEKQKKTEIDIVDSFNRTALILAASINNSEIAEFLIEKKADVKICDSNGLNALNFAAINNNSKLVQLLIDKGCDINIPKDIATTLSKFSFWNIDEEIKNQTSEISESLSEIKKLLQEIDEAETVCLSPSFLTPETCPSKIGYLSNGLGYLSSPLKSFSSSVKSNIFLPIPPQFNQFNIVDWKYSEDKKIDNNENDFFEAAKNNNISEVDRLIKLIKNDNETNSFNEKAAAALILAENYKPSQPELIHLIIDLGYDLENDENKIAFEADSSACLVQLLVKSGADITACDNSGKSALGHSIYKFALRHISPEIKEMKSLIEDLLKTTTANQIEESHNTDTISGLDFVIKNLQKAKVLLLSRDTIKEEVQETLASIKELAEDITNSISKVRETILIQQLEKTSQRRSQEIQPSSRPRKRSQEKIINKTSALEEIRNKKSTVELCQKITFGDTDFFDINDDVDINGHNALMFAVMHKIDLIDALMELKPKLDAKDFKGRTVLMIAIETYCTETDEAAKVKIIEFIENLLEKEADINARDINGRTPLMHAVEFHFNGSNEEVVKFLVAKKAQINLKDFNERTALHFSARNTFQPKITEFLIENGADISAKDIEGNSAAEFMQRYPAARNSLEATKLLEEDKNKQKKSGYFSLPPKVSFFSNDNNQFSEVRTFEAIIKKNETLFLDSLAKGKNCTLKNKNGHSLLMFAAENKPDFISFIASEISKKDLAVDSISPSGQNALMIAIKSPRMIASTARGYDFLNEKIKEAVIELIDKAGADLNAKDPNGRNALMYAIEYRPKIVCELIDVILQKKSQVKSFDFNATDKNGTTALMLAAASNKDDCGQLIIEKLINSGARINDKDRKGRNALMYAAYYYDGDSDTEFASRRIESLVNDFGANPKDTDYYGKTVHEIICNRRFASRDFISFLKKLTEESSQENNLKTLSSNQKIGACRG